jgi:tetratricopeptide (TPR) repeat protein
MADEIPDANGAAGERFGGLAHALEHASRLMMRDPEMAEAQCREILRSAPRQPDAIMLLGASLRLQGKALAALEVLNPLAAALPGSAPVRYECGMALGAAGRTGAAISELKEAVRIEPRMAAAWKALGDQLSIAGDSAGAEIANARHTASASDPALMQAASALVENRIAVAERLLRDYLKQKPTDVAAIRMLAEVGARLGRYDDAEVLLARALEIRPGFSAARHNYATVLYRLNKAPEALAQIELLLAEEPRHPAYRSLRAATLGRVGEYESAIEAYEALLAEFPEQPKAWMSLGHALKTVGRQDDSVVAYRRSLALMPRLGEAWWSLANLKTVRFSDADVETMRSQLALPELDPEDRFHLHFALGKALEDAGRYEGSFEHYREANVLRRQGVDYDPEEMAANVARARAMFTRDFFAAREAWGHPAPDPIFIVGLPRSGSTLIEQILASHSQVEGTQELPDIIAIAKQLGARRTRREASAYPDMLTTLSRRQLAELGAGYLQTTRIHRKTGRPFFVDKMPNNWLHTGLIQLILPKARIIDARRHPIACGFSNFKQHFARGQNYTYDLAEIGRYWRDYAGLMDQLDEVLPGRIHRVLYERVVDDPETEVRALLAYCGLPFEDACLRFWETDRAVRTASSEQVRRPIFKEGLDQWRAYEPWLGPLRDALGDMIDTYPGTTT